MKTLLLIISFTIFIPSTRDSLFAQSSGWFPQTSGTIQQLNSVHFSNLLTGWAVGDNVILTTTNGGLNWIPQNFFWGENDDYIFKSVCFSNSTTGWVVGDLFVSPPGLHFNVMLKTTNGGLNWIEQYRNGGIGLTSVYFTNSEIGWAVGDNVILTTTNGGVNWTNQTSETSYDLNSVHFSDSNTGWVVGGSVAGGVIRATTNGGNNWFTQTSGTDITLYSVYFSNSTTGCAVGGSDEKDTRSIIILTTNGGLNWFVVRTGGGGKHDREFLNSVYFPNSTTGYAVGGKGWFAAAGAFILKTTNGGWSWYPQVVPGWRLNSAHFANSNTGWAVGYGGTILKTINGGEPFVGIDPANNEVPSQFQLYQNYPNPFNPTTKIKFSIPPVGQRHAFDVQLVVYDILGREIESLVNEELKPGSYEVEFDGTHYSSGTYFYKLSSGNYAETKRMMLVK